VELAYARCLVEQGLVLVYRHPYKFEPEAT
jgi:hypothetical protein